MNLPYNTLYLAKFYLITKYKSLTAYQNGIRSSLSCRLGALDVNIRRGPTPLNFPEIPEYPEIPEFYILKFQELFMNFRFTNKICFYVFYLFIFLYPNFHTQISIYCILHIA